MLRSLRIGFFLHSIRSDWNNGNAHFLRGLVRALGSEGHAVTVFEAECDWSIKNLLEEGTQGEASLRQFAEVYPDIHIKTYAACKHDLQQCLHNLDIVLVHEWNPPAVIDLVLGFRDEIGFKALFHDTHHRASSSPQAIASMQVVRFDGVVTFGESLSRIYRERFGLDRVWTLHEAADTSVFYPREAKKTTDVVWIGNWGDEERSNEIRAFLVRPVAALRDRSAAIYGVRYPPEALEELGRAKIRFGGYLPNLQAPFAYAGARLTMHIPRQQYNGTLEGVPTIRVFEALASGIPLISAPWRDSEGLFRDGDFCWAQGEGEMRDAMEYLLSHPDAAREQAKRGLATVLERHTCNHRAAELTAICEEVLAS